MRLIMREDDRFAGIPVIIGMTEGREVPGTITVASGFLDAVVAHASILAKGGVMYDSEGAYRWITVHPHGAEEGTPVKIRASKSDPGTWHVVGGAGGKLNYLKITNLKSPEEWKENAKKRREARKAKKEAERGAERARKEQLTPEEKKAEQQAREIEKANKEALAQHAEIQKQAYVADIAELMGWSDDDWKFDAQRTALQEAGASKERIESLERQHNKRVFEKAQRVAQKAREAEILDAETRSENTLGEIPFKSEDPDEIALSDLDPDKAKKGLGYKRDISKLSDEEITKDLASRDIDALREELTRAQDAYSPDSAATAGKLAQIAAELHAAELVQKGTDKTPEELQARNDELEEQAAKWKEERAGFIGDLQALRKKAANGKLEEEEEEEALQTLELHEEDVKFGLANIQREQTDIAILLGNQESVVKGSKKEEQGRRQEDKENEIRATQGEAGVAEYRATRERFMAAMENYRAEVGAYRAAGVIKTPDLEVKPIDDPEKRRELLKRAKALDQFNRDVKKALGKDEPVDERIFGRPYFIETHDAQIDQAVIEDIENAISTKRTMSFLRELDATEAKAIDLLKLTEDQRRESMERHLSSGCFNALNEAALVTLSTPVLSRDVVDVLGAPAAAELLAWQIRQSHSPEEVEAIADGMGEFHEHNHVQQSEEAVRVAEDLLGQAREIEAGMVGNPADLLVQQELNAKRREILEEARETMGTALGSFEALASLNASLKAGKTRDIPLNMGPVQSDSAIRQLRAIGLDRDDYVLDSDGTNKLVTIKESGFAKMIRQPNPEEVRAAAEMEAIRNGDRDEDGWVPPGLTTRPATTFTDPDLPVDSFGYSEQQRVPHTQWGMGAGGFSSELAQEHLDDHVGARMADGELPNEVFADMMSKAANLPEGPQREHAINYLRELVPPQAVKDHEGKPVYYTNEDGTPRLGPDGAPIQKMRPVTADTYREKFEALGKAHAEKRYDGKGVQAFHAQQLKLQDAKTAEAIHRALSLEPRATYAFTAPGDLGSQGQRTLRHFFATEIAKVDPKSGVDTKAIEAEIAKLGEEPPKTVKIADMFGGGEESQNPDWTAWKQKRDEIVASHMSDSVEDATGATSSQWSNYVRHMGGSKQAYQAIQDEMKSRFLRQFHSSYTALHGEPLRLGKRSVAHSERHLGFIDPEKREWAAKQRKELIDKVRSRSRGRYASEEKSVREKLDVAMAEDEYMRQNTASLFGGTESSVKSLKPSEVKVDTGERYAIGEAAEAQLASIMPNASRNFRNDPTKAVNLFPGFSMSGDYVKQQRAVKAFLANKRIGAFLGTGSGKTPISIGAFTAAASDPSTGVKRGIFVVPSQVQGQFHGEMGRFVKPGAFNWHAVPGASQEERMAAHSDMDTHMVVQTHQGFRDDMLRLVAKHNGHGDDTGKAGEWFEGLDRKGRAAALRKAWDSEGIDYQASFLDEGHVTLDRKGKPDSLLSAMMTAVSDNTSHYMAMTADPLKNDVSEIRSQLDKIHTDGRYGSEADWHKRYGVNTTASTEALRREVRSNFVMSHVKPDVQVEKSVQSHALHPEQKAAYAEVMRSYQEARRDRAAGRINVEACKALSPSSFEGVDESQHMDVARAITDNIGIIKEAALNRVVNLAPPERNAKIQGILAHLKEHDTADKPVVVFAHNLEAVHHLEKALSDAGHQVTAITGEHTSREKDDRRLRFQPERGEPKANVIVLSDAGATGLNLQRGQTLIQYDTPMTAMVHNQRNGRIHRTGQTQNVNLVDMTTDTPFEAAARKRLDKKYTLKEIFTDAGDRLDDTGMAGFVNGARKRMATTSASARMEGGAQ